VHQLFSCFKEAYGSVRREDFYNIVTKLFIHMKLVVLPKMFLNETYTIFQLRKHWFSYFLLGYLKKEDASKPFLLKLV